MKTSGWPGIWAGRRSSFLGGVPLAADRPSVYWSGSNLAEPERRWTDIADPRADIERHADIATANAISGSNRRCQTSTGDIGNDGAISGVIGRYPVCSGDIRRDVAISGAIVRYPPQLFKYSTYLNISPYIGNGYPSSPANTVRIFPFYVRYPEPSMHHLRYHECYYALCIATNSALTRTPRKINYDRSH